MLEKSGLYTTLLLFLLWAYAHHVCFSIDFCFKAMSTFSKTLYFPQILISFLSIFEFSGVLIHPFMEAILELQYLLDLLYRESVPVKLH